MEFTKIIQFFRICFYCSKYSLCSGQYYLARTTEKHLFVNLHFPQCTVGFEHSSFNVLEQASNLFVHVYGG